jgi:hypothetical protein
LLLNAISFYEVGLNTVRIMGPPVGPYLIGISQYYFESGLIGLAIASILFALVATRHWTAWLAFTVPGLLARVVTGTVLFARGDANMWPIFLAGELVLAIGSLGIFWVVGKAKAKVRLRGNENPA